MIQGPSQRRPVRRRRRHSHKVYVRRQILALVLCVGVVFGVLFGLDQLVHAAIGGGGAPRRTSTAGTPSRHDPRKPPPTTTTTSTTVPRPARPGGNPVAITAVGDLILGTAHHLPSDPAGYLVNVRSVMSAPIEIGNLEGALTDATASVCAKRSAPAHCQAFRNPPAYARDLRQDGFTVMDSANPHSHDYGARGVSDTTAALKQAGIAQTGLPGQIALTSDGRTKVAVVGFAPYTDTNDLLDLASAKAIIREARVLAPVVIVYMQAGAAGPNAYQVTGREEHQHGKDLGNPEKFAHAAVDDGASAVVASGNRVVRGMEFYKGHLIDYSLGDFAGYDNFSTSGNLRMAGFVKLHLSRAGAFRSAAWVSLLLNAHGEPTVDTTGEAAVFINQLSSRDFGSAAAKVQPDGSIVAVKPGAPSSPSTSATTASPTSRHSRATSRH